MSVDPRELLGYADPSEAPESAAAEKLTLKSRDLFAVTTRVGDIAPAGARDLGFFREDTRFLSLLQLSLKGGPPVCLSSQTSADYVTQIDLTVTEREFGGVLLGDPVNYLHVRREQLIDGGFSDRLVLTNFVVHPISLWVELSFAADFADVFEIRGFGRPRRGTYLEPVVGARSVTFRYRGLDRRLYRTELTFLDPPARLDAARARFELRLAPMEIATLELRVHALVDEESAPALVPFTRQARGTRDEYRALREACTLVETDNEHFSLALDQGLTDLHALGSTRGGEPVIAAGIPWYTCPFGRDTLLTAYEALPVSPRFARDALVYLAAHQGTRLDPFRDEEPGKILHELRTGEMARCGEIPHTPYYGSVDATPLWLVLLDEYHRWTADDETVQRLLPAAERALAWMDDHGDRDGDGFLEYERRAETGLLHQGWKDSKDGVIFADGRVAQAPIALVEVQGYAFDALRRLGAVYRRLGDPVRAARLGARARKLGAAIDRAFWMEEKGTYAEALDRDKRQVDAITSNPGHLLFSRAVPPDRAERVAAVLLGPGLYSGWGVRTLAKGQPAYNPLSYHNGTVWPHDNAICAMGLATYGRKAAALSILDGLFHASLHFRHHRLPELFCGLGRSAGEFPVQYPVACAPQAWSSAAFFLLLRAALGIEPDAPRRTVHVRDPALPPWLGQVCFRRMQVGASKLDLHFTRTPAGVLTSAHVLEGPRIQVKISVG